MRDDECSPSSGSEHTVSGHQAALLSRSICRSHNNIWFQLSRIWATTLRSPEPARATGGKPTFDLVLAKVFATPARSRSDREGCPP